MLLIVVIFPIDAVNIFEFIILLFIVPIFPVTDVINVLFKVVIFPILLLIKLLLIVVIFPIFAVTILAFNRFKLINEVATFPETFKLFIFALDDTVKFVTVAPLLLILNISFFVVGLVPIKKTWLLSIFGVLYAILLSVLLKLKPAYS